MGADGWGQFFYVMQDDHWLVIDSARGKAAGFFPRIVATCSDKTDAETICDALAANDD